MASKYEKVFPKLKKLPVQDPTYQQQVDVVKTSILENQEVPVSGEMKLDSDDLVHAHIELCLEEIAETVKELCGAILKAPRGRRHASVLARYWLELRKVEDSVANELKNVRLLLTAMEQLGVEQFEVEATDRIRFDELGAVSSRPEVVIKVHDPDVFRDWCVKNQLFRSLNMHHGTAQALTRGLLVDGKTEPDGITAYVHTKFTK